MGVGFAAVLAAVFAAAATGLSGAVAVLERRSAPVPSLTLASALACIALLALAGTSLMQLGRPQLIFAAFSNPASSIFKLGVAWIVALAACAAYLAAIHRAAYESTCRKLALIASVAAALVLMAHASNYVMPWRAAWNTWSIVLPFFGYAALIGVATMGLVGAVHGYALDRRVSLAAGGFAVLADGLARADGRSGDLVLGADRRCGRRAPMGTDVVGQTIESGAYRGSVCGLGRLCGLANRCAAARVGCLEFFRAIALFEF